MAHDASARLQREEHSAQAQVRSGGRYSGYDGRVPDVHLGSPSRISTRSSTPRLSHVVRTSAIRSGSMSTPTAFFAPRFAASTTMRPSPQPRRRRRRPARPSRDEHRGDDRLRRRGRTDHVRRPVRLGDSDAGPSAGAAGCATSSSRRAPPRARRAPRRAPPRLR